MEKFIYFDGSCKLCDTFKGIEMTAPEALRSSRYHVGRPPPNLEEAFRRLQEHRDITSRGYFVHGSTARTLILSEVRNERGNDMTRGEADDYVRYLKNVGVLLEEKGVGDWFDQDRAEQVVRDLASGVQVVPVDGTYVASRIAALRQVREGVGVLERHTVYSMGNPPPLLPGALDDLCANRGVRRDGYCVLQAARSIVQAAQGADRNLRIPEDSALHTIRFLCDVGVLIENQDEGIGTVYWLDQDRAKQLKAFLASGTPMSSLRDPLVRLAELTAERLSRQEEGPRPTESNPDPVSFRPLGASSGQAGSIGPDREAEEPSAPPLPDAASRYRWRIHLLPRDYAAWALLHDYKFIFADTVPRIAIKVVGGELDPALCAEWSVTPEVLLTFIRRCIQHHIFEQIRETNGHLTLRVLVDLATFDVVEISERGELRLDEDVLKLIDYIRTQHREGTLNSKGDLRHRVGSHLTRWMETHLVSVTSGRVTAKALLRIVTGQADDEQANRRLGILHYRPKYQDNLVCWPGFEGAEIVLRGSVQAPAPPPVAPTNPSPSDPPVPNPALPPAVLLDAFRDQLAMAEKDLETVQGVFEIAQTEFDAANGSHVSLDEELARIMARADALREQIREAASLVEVKRHVLEQLRRDQSVALGRIETLRGKIDEQERELRRRRDRFEEEAARVRREAEAKVEAELAALRRQLGL